MKLEKIGFYSMKDSRAKTVFKESRLVRCELLITARCNFKCPYCRKMKFEDISLKEAKRIIDLWSEYRLENIRFSGGEPTLHKNLVDIVRYSKQKGIKRIAVSTNGYSDFKIYKTLLKAGVNDLSISLDACCASMGDIMSGIKNSFEKVTHNISKLSKLTYLTIGVVLTDKNKREVENIVKFSDTLGVSDIRVIPAAQNDFKLKLDIPKYILRKYPILNFRVTNFNENKGVRGIKKSDNSRCPLVLDDVAISNGKHYPCIIYMRERGKAIGKFDEDFMAERKSFYEKHNTHKDKICRKNCLDVCVMYNNKVRKYAK